jgi:hypothetical protein
VVEFGLLHHVIRVGEARVILLRVPAGVIQMDMREDHRVDLLG